MGVLGKFLSIVGVIEFQKRGLPHIHILLIIETKPSQSNEQNIDKFICAEIPDKTKLPELYKKVISFNIHGPCSEERCLENGKCIKKFPKEYVEKTFFVEDSYPNYRRRSPAQGGHTHTKFNNQKATLVDNRYVVPYNPYLTQKYNCHINVEYLYSINSIKYMYKYIGKGTDQATVSLSNTDEDEAQILENNDEILKYHNLRYIGPVEACSQIFEYSICYRYPAVMKLELHLENQHQVLFDPKQNKK